MNREVNASIRTPAELAKSLQHFHCVLNSADLVILMNMFPSKTQDKDGLSGFDFKAFSTALFPSETIDLGPMSATHEQLPFMGRFSNTIQPVDSKTVPVNVSPLPANTSPSAPTNSSPKNTLPPVKNPSPKRSTGQEPQPQKAQLAITYNRRHHERRHERPNESAPGKQPKSFPVEEVIGHGVYQHVQKPRFDMKPPGVSVDTSQKNTIAAGLKWPPAWSTK